MVQSVPLKSRLHRNIMQK
nr:unnamed protein product [Callosobruchus chinensis]